MTRHPIQPLTGRLKPRVSVVVPCYNYGRFLAGCICSVLFQPGVEVDILIIDDASSDGSDVVAKRLAECDPRIRVICHPTNRGHIATYNEGLQEVDAQYLVLLSADDMLTSGALSRAVAVMEIHKTVGLVYGNPLSFSGRVVPTARVN